MPVEGSAGSINHRVEVTTVETFLKRQLNFDVNETPSASDWLSFPSQRLRGLTDGTIHHDDTSELTRARQTFIWYPQDVWLYMLAAGWQRIGQEQALMSRAGFAGDDLGAHLIASRLIRDTMRLCFLLEQRYAPYPKWFGTAFKKLDCGPQLLPFLRAVQTATDWQTREENLNNTLSLVALKQNDLGVSATITTKPSQFHDRPFWVMDGEGIAKIVLNSLTNSDVKRIAAKSIIGNVDQWSDNTDLLERSSRYDLLKLYI